MRDPKNWLTLSVLANAILGGLLVSLITDSESWSKAFLIGFFLFVVIMVSKAHKRTPEEQKEYLKSLAPSNKSNRGK